MGWRGRAGGAGFGPPPTAGPAPKEGEQHLWVSSLCHGRHSPLSPGGGMSHPAGKMFKKTLRDALTNLLRREKHNPLA